MSINALPKVVSSHDDVLRCFSQCRVNLPRVLHIDAQQIGVLGSSAGGWVAPRAAVRSEIPVAFVITLVGAATSVQEQQSDNARYITTQRGLSEEDSRNAQRYVELMFNDVADPETQFAEMQTLIAHAEETGWDVFTLSRTPFSKVCPWAEGYVHHIEVDFSDPGSIETANLELYLLANAEGPLQVDAHRVKKNWKLGKATWRDRKDDVDWNTQGGGYVAAAPCVAKHLLKRWPPLPCQKV